LTWFTTAKTESGITSLTTGKVPVGTQPAASLHQRSAAEGVIGMTVICVTSSTAEMHVAGLKTGAKSERVEQERRVERDYDYYYGPYSD
jgi:hypothetical protein